MSMVRFAYICDRCAQRGEEYGAMPECPTCERDICAACTARVESEWDYDHRSTVLCHDCAKRKYAGVLEVA